MTNYFKLNCKTIELSSNINDVFCKHIQLGEMNEAGGILIGSYIKDTNDIIIDFLTEPQTSDIRKKYHFIRKEVKHKEILDSLWISSNKTSGYIGEWHTHPEDIPKPSSQDIFNWKRLLKTTIFFGDYLFFIIVGRLKIHLWVGHKKTKSISKLEEKK